MKLNKYLLLLISFSAFMACSKEIGEESKEPEVPKGPVALDPHIAGVSLTTRGGAAKATDINTLGIYAVPVKTEGAPSSYHLYKLTNGNASPNDADNTLWLELYKVTIYSFHPAGTADVTQVTLVGTDEAPVPTITIPASAITAEQTGITKKDDNNYDFAKTENDYMYGVAYDKSKEDDNDSNSNPYLTTQPIANNGYASGDVLNPNECGPEIAIGLKHAFAQIRFILKKSSSYGGEAIVTNVTYKRNLQTLIGKPKDNSADPAADTDSNTGADASNERLPITMNLANGKLNNLAEAAETTYSYIFADQDVKATNDENTIKLTNYILPNTSTNAVITITVDGKEMKLNRENDTQFEAGNIYTYNIVINPTGLTLSGFTVSGWGDDQKQPDITI